jgi:HEAT repeat protein
MSERADDTSRGELDRADLKPVSPPPPTRRGRLLLMIAACLGCGILLWVWKTTGDQQHREAVAAARTLHETANPAERASAIRDLVRYGKNDGKLAITSIVASLNDPDLAVRVVATRSLGPAACASALRGVDDAEVKTAIETLLRTLQDPLPSVRAAAINSLASIAMTESPSGVIQPEPLISAFTLMLKDPDAVVRIQAISAIGFALPERLGDPPPELIAALHDEESSNRLIAIEVLTRFRAGLEKVLPYVIRGFEQAGSDTPERQAYAAAIRKTRPPFASPACLPVLVKALTSPDAQLRFEATSSIGGFGPESRIAVSALIEVLKKQPLDLEKLGPGKPNPSTWDPASAAASTLGQILGTLGDSDSDQQFSRKIVAALISVVESGHPARRFAAIHALKEGRFVPAKTAAIPALIRLVKQAESSEDPFENGPAAAMGLSFIFRKTESAGEVMQVLTASIASRSKIGTWAIESLKTFGPEAESAIPDLIRVLEKPGDEQSPSDLDKRVVAARALSEIAPGTPSSEKAVLALTIAVESRTKAISLAAMMALARFGPAASAAVPALDARQKNDPDPEVKRLAGTVLKTIRAGAARAPGEG